MINGGNKLREDNDLREAIILNISHLKSNKLNIGLFLLFQIEFLDKFSELFSSLIVFAGSQCFST